MYPLASTALLTTAFPPDNAQSSQIRVYSSPIYARRCKPQLHPPPQTRHTNSSHRHSLTSVFFSIDTKRELSPSPVFKIHSGRDRLGHTTDIGALLSKTSIDDILPLRDTNFSCWQTFFDEWSYVSGTRLLLRGSSL